ncbi:glycosyl transferase family 28 protein [Roseiconus lacunae]|uniref:glycosyl transferase family 28 protein n=1 Tax=Roseiconus lacunae TaxID=2605694 RepID=UPI003091BD35|nr:glycosyl transferase family 28 protein [Stieleria sp. HD01]
MNDLQIGFYVHYHGMGHKRRTEAILRHLKVPSSVITSRLGDLDWKGANLLEVIEIACDIDDVSFEGAARSQDVPALHYAPLWTDSITRRVAEYTAWLSRTKPDLMVVDVSAEISMLTRLASIPQVVVRQHGDRRDPAHLNAYAAAEALLAPFPRCMEDELTPDWVIDKSVYLSGFSAHNDDDKTVSFSRPTIVVMFGKGGTDSQASRLAEAATAVSDFDWVVVGKEKPPAMTQPMNLRYVGWTDQPLKYVRAATMVVSAAGHNSVMELGRERARFIAIAEERPFDEQRRKVHILNRERLAVGVPQWPKVDEWKTLIGRAMNLDPSPWDTIYREDGAIEAARFLELAALRSNLLRRGEQSGTTSLCSGLFPNSQIAEMGQNAS